MERKQTLAIAESLAAFERSISINGLGELQALREIQAERLMRDNFKRSR